MITLTDKAMNKVKQLMEQDGIAGHGLRVFVQAGGCSGMQYGLTFDKEPADGDAVEEVNGVSVYMDQNSLPYLEGIEIDYVDDMMGSGFDFKNPNATQTCGCGTSFR